jgi:hypothetical protein
MARLDTAELSLADEDNWRHHDPQSADSHSQGGHPKPVPWILQQVHEGHPKNISLIDTLLAWISATFRVNVRSPGHTEEMDLQEISTKCQVSSTLAFQFARMTSENWPDPMWVRRKYDSIYVVTQATNPSGTYWVAILLY